MPYGLGYMKNDILFAKNKKALYEHQLIEKYVAGIVLKGYEVKAIREKKAKLDGAYVQMLSDGPYVVNMYIGAYSKRGKSLVADEDFSRSRKLLLNKKEINDINRELAQKGNTAIPLALIMQKNLVKLEFAVVKGKKEFEKKVVAKERQIKRDLEVEAKDFQRGVDL